jgi:KDO2-lipid IV(A) lauroyltransferase
MGRKIQEIMNRLLFGFLLLLSRLPLFILYRLSDLFYLVLISVFPYRQKVIVGNLKKSFPDIDSKQIRLLRNKFYRHFADLVIEGIKNLTISKAELNSRFIFKNPDLVQGLIAKNKSIMLISGHYGNWEWMITSLALQFNTKVVGIGMPLTNSFWDLALNKRRSRFGLQVVHSGNYKESLNQEGSKVFLVLSDQSPSNSENAYWTRFLNQPTGVLFGAEFMAHENDLIPVFFSINKIKRGYYEVEMFSYEADISNSKYGSITEWHTRQLEELIQQKPEFWLWSHKRWKREAPTNFVQLRKKQEERFNKRFGSV